MSRGRVGRGNGSRMSVLVTDGGERSALAAVRSLGRAGHRPFVCSSAGRPLAGASRHAAGVARVADPFEDLEGAVEDVRDLAERWDVDLVLPVTDASLTALLPERGRLPGLADVFPDDRAFHRVSNKARVAEVARETGIAVPDQRRLSEPNALSPREAAELEYPLVVKPARSVVRGEDRLLATPSVACMRDAGGMVDHLRSLPEHAFPVLLQEYIRGEGRGIFLLRHAGENRAVFAHRRIREKPPGGGASVCRESVRADPELVARSARLLDLLGWDGVAMVEFRRDVSSGVAYLMEVNPRFWGSLQLAVDAGVDFPDLTVNLADGGGTRLPPRYRCGVRCRWWWGELDHLLTRLRHGDGEVPPTAPGRWSTLLDLVRPSTAGDRREVLRLSDPMPFLRETRQWLARA